MDVAYIQDRVGNVSAVFTLNLAFPLLKDFLRHVQEVAMTDERACPTWGEDFVREEAEEAWYFMAKEMRGIANVPAHRVDLYTIHRGLGKLFELRFTDIGIASRQAVLKALYEQRARPSIFSVCPRLASEIVQLALFDQVVY